MEMKKTERSKTAKKKLWFGKRKRSSSLVAKVNKLIQSQELKWLDTSVTDPAAGLVVPLNNVPQGDDAVARDGRKINMRSCEFVVAAYTNPSVGAPVRPRLVIVYDKVCNGLLPAATDIFTSTDGIALKNLNNSHRFQIVYDNYAGLKRGHDPLQVFVPSAGTQYGIFHIKDYVKMDHDTIYGATGSGTIAGTQTGALYAVFLGGGAASTGTVSNFRVRFVDS